MTSASVGSFSGLQRMPRKLNSVAAANDVTWPRRPGHPSCLHFFGAPGDGKAHGFRAQSGTRNLMSAEGQAGRRPTVAVAIVPRLFRDALTIALERCDVKVIHIHIDDPKDVPDGVVNLAIICHSLEVAVDARTVIKMPPEDGDTALLFRRDEATREVPVPDLEALLQLVRTSP